MRRRRARALGVRPLAGAALLSLAVAGTLAAQRLEPRPFPQQRVESYRIRSTVMGRTYDVSIGLPESYRANPTRRYPTLFVTDGNDLFPIGFGIADGLMIQESIEDLIVVSVGAPFELGRPTNTRRRVHEFSTAWPMTDEFGRRVRELCDQLAIDPPQRECTGGAPAFLSFITTELIPAVAARVRADTARLGLYGLSAGGFFAAWAMFQPTSPFTTYIISSPAMAYGVGEVFRQEARYAETHTDLAVGLYLASGALEMSDPLLEGTSQIVSGQTHLTGVLASRKYPGLRMYSEIHPGLGHVDGAPTSFARGLRLLYPKR